jgi:hypothetical protein
MVQFLSINFFSWISSVFVGFFKSFFLCHSVYTTSLIFYTMAQQLPVGQDLHMIEDSWSHSDTPHSVGLPWTSDLPVAETSTWQHTTLKKDRHPSPWRNSKPQSQQASGQKPTPQTARPLRSAHCTLKHSKPLHSPPSPSPTGTYVFGAIHTVNADYFPIQNKPVRFVSARDVFWKVGNERLNIIYIHFKLQSTYLRDRIHTHTKLRWMF